jgi:hypothetical protein
MECDIMEWIVTLAQGTDPARLDAALAAHGGRRQEDSAPVPMTEGETAVVVDGPADLPDALRGVPGVTGVYPSSEMVLY